MTALTNALVKAGLPDTTLTKRIWLWIQDHPGCTVTDIHKGLKTHPGITGTRISDLHNRKMITKTHAFRNTVKGKVDVFEFRVTMKEFELLPRVDQSVFNHKAPAPVQGLKAVLNRVNRQMLDNMNVGTEIIKTGGNSTVQQKVCVAVDVETMSVSEARALYLKLHAIFGK